MKNIALFLLALFSATLSCAEITYAQISPRQAVEIERLDNIKWSSDGRSAAFLVSRSSLARNSVETQIYLASAPEFTARVLVTAEIIGDIDWTPDGRSIVYVALAGEDRAEIGEFIGRGYQAFSVNIDTGRITQLTRDRVGIAAGVRREHAIHFSPFRLSPDGRRGIYYRVDLDAAEAGLRIRSNGSYFYSPTTDVTGLFDIDLAALDVPEATLSFRIVDIARGEEREFWVPPATPSPALVDNNSIQWSPDGERVALVWGEARNFRLSVLSSRTFEVVRSRTFASIFSAIWQPDGSAISVEGALGPNFSLIGWHRYALGTGSLEPLERSPENSGIRDRLALGREVEALTQDRVRRCAANSGGQHVICVHENSVTPPEARIYEFNEQRTAARGRTLVSLNSSLRSLRYGEVQTVAALPGERRPAEFQFPAAGIVMPVGYQAGKRYPLLVVLYNQFAGEHLFTGDGALRNYPPQVFAANGYVVVLQNLPDKWSDWPAGNFDASRENHTGKLVSWIRRTVDDLVARGIADPNRMGIMGWSWGGFFAPYIQTHFPGWFQAGATGEGGNHYPGSYWMGDDSSRVQEDMFFGPGGPLGPNRSRWEAVSPVTNAYAMISPMLLEASNAPLPAIELYQAIRASGGQAELYVYPNEGHEFIRPRNVLASVERHLDWFNFWLQGREDSSLHKLEQYKRWRALRLTNCGRQPSATLPIYCRN